MGTDFHLYFIQSAQVKYSIHIIFGILFCRTLEKHGAQDNKRTNSAATSECITR
jgi:hypothetical protein